jgi:hypothetical protein
MLEENVVRAADVTNRTTEKETAEDHPRCRIPARSEGYAVPAVFSELKPDAGRTAKEKAAISR